MKKLLASTLVLTGILTTFAGCSSDGSSNTSVKEVSQTGVTATFDTVTIQYDDTKWECLDPETTGMLVLVELGSNEEEQASISYYAPEALESDSIEAYKELIDMEFEMYLGADTKVIESSIKQIGDRECLYIELKTEINDEVIDELIETEVITEESLEEMGGREELLSWPTTTQVLTGTIEDQNGYIFSGVTYDEKTKSNMVDALTLAVQTLEIAQ